MLDRVMRALPALSWMALIFALSSRQRFPHPPGFSIFSLSIAAHLVLYGVLALLALLAVDPELRPSRSAQLTVIVVALLYGLSDEFHQSFVPGRNASAFDLVVDTLGATIAVLFWSLRRAIRSAMAFR